MLDKKIIKIALIGTHRTGKTTQAYDLIAQLRKNDLDAEILKEVARDCPYPVNEEATEEAQKWIIFTQMTREIELKRQIEINTKNQGALKCNAIVGDRSALDSLIYLEIINI